MRGEAADGQSDGLCDVIRDATRSLACLDAERLEELAASCRLLTRQNEQERIAPPREDAVRAQAELAVLGRLLVETQQNLRVLRSHTGGSQARGDYGRFILPAWIPMEAGRGDH